MFYFSAISRPTSVIDAQANERVSIKLAIKKEEYHKLKQYLNSLTAFPEISVHTVRNEAVI